MLAKTLHSNAFSFGLIRPLAMGFASPTKKIG